MHAVTKRQAGTVARVIPGQLEHTDAAEVEQARRAPVVRGRPPRRRAQPEPADWTSPRPGLACDVWRVSGTCDQQADVRLEVSSPTTPGMWDLCDGHARQLLGEAEARGVRVYIHEWHTQHPPPGRREITRHQPYRRLQFAPQPRSDYAPTVTGPVNPTLAISGEAGPARPVRFFRA